MNGSYNSFYGGNYVQGDLHQHITMGDKSAGDNNGQTEKLPDVVMRYRALARENITARWRLKLEQSKVDGRSLYIPLMYEHTRVGGNILSPTNKRNLKVETFNLTELTWRLSLSETSLVEAPAGYGKSTTAAKIMELWSTGEGERFDICLFWPFKTHSRIALSKLIWGQINPCHGVDSDAVFQELHEKGSKVLILIDSLDELSLRKDLIDEVSFGSRSPSTEISLEDLIINVLAKNILPEATVLGFSRSADKINKELLDGDAEIFRIKKPTEEDVQILSNQASTEKKEARTIQKKILNLRSKFDTNVLMMNEVIKLRGKLSDEEIRTESEFRLLLLLMNIQRNKVKDIKLTFTNLPKQTQKGLLAVASLCERHIRDEKENIDIFEGTTFGEHGEEWEPNLEDSEEQQRIPMQFLADIGIFSIPETYGRVTLTAHHMSHLEFLAALSCLQSSSVEEDDKPLHRELLKIRNYSRFKAVVFHLR